MPHPHPHPHDAPSSGKPAAPAHRPLLAALKPLKLKAQRTGWLPYMFPAIAGSLFLLVSGIGALIGPAAFWPPFCIAGLFFARDGYDILTVKLGLRIGDPRPCRRDGLDNFELMRQRRACRSFRLRGLADADREEVLCSIREHTRSDLMIGTSPVRLEHVVAPGLATWPTVGAREFIIAIAPREYDRVSIIDVGRALLKVVLDATRAGVATCCIGPGTDLSDAERLLGDRFDPEQDHVVCICALGYRSRFIPLASRVVTRAQTGRLPLEELFFADSALREPLALGEDRFARFEAVCEGARWSPSAFNKQTTRCAAVLDEGGKAVERFDFYATTASRYYAPVAVGIWCGSWEVGCETAGIPGRFGTLTAEERREPAASDLPRYQMSWFADGGAVEAGAAVIGV